METAKDYKIANGSGKVSIVVNLADMISANFDLPFVKFLITVLEAYYPESMGVCLLLNAPFIFNGIWAIIKPLLDSVVASKIKFINQPQLLDYINADSLPKAFGGHDPFEYKYESVENNQISVDTSKAEISLQDIKNHLEITHKWSTESNVTTERQTQLIALKQWWLLYIESKRPKNNL